MLLVGALSATALALALLGAIGAFASGGPAGAKSERTVEVTRTEAVLTATVFPHGAETECQFEYGTEEGVLDKVAACTFAPGSRSIGVPETANLKGLTQDTVYFWRIHAHNTNGGENGAEQSFTTLPHAPGANTEAASEVKRTSATLTGIVHANGSEVTECYFEWGPSEESLTERTPCVQTEFKGSSEPSEEVEATAHISGLAETHVYYYRLFAKNSVGEHLGGRTHLETLPAPPRINPEHSRLVTRNSATLWGYVNPNDSKVTECYFLYGPEGEVNKRAECESFGAGSGETHEEVTAKVEGLHESTRYQVLLVAANAIGSNEGGPTAFETEPSEPLVMMHHARDVTATGAELSASVNPNSTETACYFEYGTTPALGSVAPCEKSAGNGDEWVHVGAKVSGLTRDTTYLVRVVAFNEHGSDRGGEGEHHNFTTANGGEAPVVEKLTPKKGTSAGGNVVKIKGKHFEDVTAVYFGFVEGTLKSESVEQIEAIAPPGVGKVDITVATTNGTSQISSKDVYTYGKPEIKSLTPDEGPDTGGTEVTVTGNGFEVGQHGTEFVFGKSTATSVECTSTTTCTVVAPPTREKHGAHEKGAMKVVAKVNGGKSNKPSFTYTE